MCWSVEKDMIEGNKALKTYNNEFINSEYKHTYLLVVDYESDRYDKLPNEETLSFINQLEDMCIKKIISTQKLKHFKFVGRAIFNQIVLLAFVGDEEVDWKEIISKLLPYPRIRGERYLNDNMKFYNLILLSKSK